MKVFFTKIMNMVSLLKNNTSLILGVIVTV